MPGLTNAMVTGGNYFDKDVEAIEPVDEVEDAPTKEDFNELVKAFNALLEQLQSNVNIQV